ncbi:MAG: PAS domain S-box protein [Methanotrichaceae archaeon]|jgi:PAS domain S-box-containing protein
MEEKRLESEERYGTLFNSMTEGFALHEIICDEDGEPCDYRFLEVNSAFERQTGLNREEVIGKTERQLFPNDDSQRIGIYGAVALTGQPVHFETHSKGLNRYYEIYAHSPAEGKFAALFVDITERKQMEAALRESEENYRTIVETANEGIWVVDSETMTTYVNSRMAEMLGYSSGEMIGKKSFEFMDEEGKARLDLLLERRRQGINESIEIKFLRKDGSPLWAISGAASLRDKDGKFTGSLGMLTDITERKQTEKALQDVATKAERDRSQLEAMFAAQNDSVIIYDTKMNVQRANESFIETYGFDPVDLNLRDIIQRVSCRRLDGRPFLLNEQPTPRALHGEKVAGQRFIVTRADGVEVAVETSSGPIQMEDRIIGSVTVWRDITERVMAEDVLRLNEEKAKILSDVTSRLLASDKPITIVEELCLRVMAFLDCHAFFNYLVDDERGCLHLNASAGVSAEKAHEIEWLDYGVAVCGCAARDKERIVSENIPETPDPRTDLVKSLGIKAYACHPLMAQGQVMGTLSFGTRSRTTFSDDDLAMMKIVAEHVAIAMTRVRDEEALRKSKNELEQKVQERTGELEKALDASEESVRAKAAFLANMSHELRTPMNAVIGFSSLLLDDSLTPEPKEYIEGIRNGGEALLAVIDDILEYSRAEKAKIELEHQPFSLKHLIDESLDLVATQASKKGLNLSHTINYGTPDTIIGDHGRLRQILVNLLTNAVKFTEDGEVSLSVSSKAVDGNVRKISFAVEDSGIGIPQEKMKEIFEPFTQVERTLSRKRDGVGLGLAIAKNLVELMGGTIWTESTQGKGTIFSFTIEAEIIPGKQLDFGRMDDGIVSARLSGLKPMRILVAEDNPSNQKVLVEMLRDLDIDPTPLRTAGRLSRPSNARIMIWC